VLISSFFAFPPFNEKFGVEYEPGKYQVTAPWQSGLSNGARVGEICGLLINGVVAERYGYRLTMIGSLIAMIAFIFIPFFAQNIETLVAGTVLMGIPVSLIWMCMPMQFADSFQWGVFQTLTTTYAAEGETSSVARRFRHNRSTDPSLLYSSMSSRPASLPHHLG
jgi:SP family general alpha glucoside:H+ symporter-like MFS transporter